MSAANSYYLSCKYTSALRKKEKKAVYRRFPKKKKNVIQPMWNWTVGAGRAIWEGERKENEGLSGMRERVETRARYIIASRRLCWRDEEGKKRKEKKRKEKKRKEKKERRRRKGKRGGRLPVGKGGRARAFGSSRVRASGVFRHRRNESAMAAVAHKSPLPPP